MTAARWRELAWIAVPFAVFLLVLQRLWFDAPVWDDYDTILGLLIRNDEVHGAREWLAMVFGQHNEHRIATTRLVALALAKFGPIDFRVLMLVGDLAVLGTFLFIRRAFRDQVPAWAIGAAAIAMFQWSYYEAALMGSAALPHLGVVFFAFACLYFAARGDGLGVVLGIVFGLLAAGSQANGLLPLPIAAAGCAWQRRWRPAVVFAVASAIVWALYFHGYSRPAGHPSPFLSLSMPFATMQMFLVVVGGLFPGAPLPTAAGAVVVAGLAWLTWKRFWKTHFTVALWTLFLLATGGMAAMARVGFGVTQASRYAIGASCLLVIMLLGVESILRLEGRRWMVAAVTAAIAFNVAATWKAWPGMHDSTLRGHLLREARAAGPGVAVDRFGGAYYPDPNWAVHVLTVSSQRGFYDPPREVVHAAHAVLVATLPAASVEGGHLDTIEMDGPRLIAAGWTEAPAIVPGRSLEITSTPAAASAGPVAILARPDVAMALHDPSALYTGFRVELRYGSEEDARRAAATLCMASQAPGREPVRLFAPHVCPG